MSVEVINDRRRNQVVLHGWDDRQAGRRVDASASPNGEDVPTHSQWHLVDYLKVMAAGSAFGALVAYGPAEMVTTFVAVGITHLVPWRDWRSLFHRVRRSWTTWRRPGRHRADRRAPRFCPA